MVAVLAAAKRTLAVGVPKLELVNGRRRPAGTSEHFTFRNVYRDHERVRVTQNRERNAPLFRPTLHDPGQMAPLLYSNPPIQSCAAKGRRRVGMSSELLLSDRFRKVI